MSRTFLIIETDPIVAEDLRQTVEEVDPTAKVRIAGSSTLANWLEALNEPIDIAILHGSFAQLEATGVLNALAERDTRIVILSAAAEDVSERHAGVRIVTLPFSAGMIRDAILAA
ncbi:hypothetical protein HKCCE2091_05610 [Rhodobacterales bacterium HKCCE2091]|nr:hypothetical protein [Rhodobacterales bacterium HKCCE2091]